MAKRGWTAKAAHDIDTLVYMTELYCQAHHAHADKERYEGVAETDYGHQRRRSAYLCASCAKHTRYGEMRRLACPHGDAKMPCKACPIHCYKPEERAFERAVMRYSGPRALLHPHLIGAALKHMWDMFTAFLQEAYEARSC